jgi:hypothetical protein
MSASSTRNNKAFASFEKQITTNTSPAPETDVELAGASNLDGACFTGAAPPGYLVQCDTRYKLNSNKLVIKRGSWNALSCGELCGNRFCCGGRFLARRMRCELTLLFGLEAIVRAVQQYTDWMSTLLSLPPVLRPLNTQGAMLRQVVSCLLSTLQEPATSWDRWIQK